MAPWDMELPKFINDPRYLGELQSLCGNLLSRLSSAFLAAVKQLRVRRDLFDEFCKAKIREQRAAKKRAAESAGAARVDVRLSRALKGHELTCRATAAPHSLPGPPSSTRDIDTDSLF